MSNAQEHKLIIYQILVRLFGNRNLNNVVHGTIEQNGVGKLNDINELCLRELKQFGYTHIWFCGILEHATMTNYEQFGIRRDHPHVVKGLAGSPYAIKDYYDIDPDLAVDVENRMGEFEQLVQRTHEQDLKLIIDFVPNHVAREYHSDQCPEQDFGLHDDRTKAFSANNDFYYIVDEDLQVPSNEHLPSWLDRSNLTPFQERPARATGNNVFHSKPSITDWYETVKLNYGVDYSTMTNHFHPRPALWEKMYRILTYWIDKGVDGFRCDMAEMVPVEFWHWLIESIHQRYSNRHIIFIAEIYQKDLYQQYIEEGLFDYLYDKVGMYDCLRSIIENGSTNGNSNEITRIHHEQIRIEKHLLRFLENHDEIRIASKAFTGNPWKALPAAVCTAVMHSGPFMIYFGQELGVTCDGVKGFQGDDGRTTIFDYWGIPVYQTWYNNGLCDGSRLTNPQKALRLFYQSLIQLIHNHRALYSADGKLVDLQYANYCFYDTRRIISFIRYIENAEKLLFVMNFDYQTSFDIELLVPDDVRIKIGLEPTKDYYVKEIFIDRNICKKLLWSNPLSLTLPGNQVYVFEIVENSE